MNILDKHIDHHISKKSTKVDIIKNLLGLNKIKSDRLFDHFIKFANAENKLSYIVVSSFTLGIGNIYDNDHYSDMLKAIPINSSPVVYQRDEFNKLIEEEIEYSDFRGILEELKSIVKKSESDQEENSNIDWNSISTNNKEHTALKNWAIQNDSDPLSHAIFKFLSNNENINTIIIDKINENENENTINTINTINIINANNTKIKKEDIEFFEKMLSEHTKKSEINTKRLENIKLQHYLDETEDEDSGSNDLNEILKTSNIKSDNVQLEKIKKTISDSIVQVESIKNPQLKDSAKQVVKNLNEIRELFNTKNIHAGLHSRLLNMIRKGSLYLDQKLLSVEDDNTIKSKLDLMIVESNVIINSMSDW